MKNKQNIYDIKRYTEIIIAEKELREMAQQRGYNSNIIGKDIEIMKALGFPSYFSEISMGRKNESFFKAWCDCSYQEALDFIHLHERYKEAKRYFPGKPKRDINKGCGEQLEFKF